MSDDDQISAYLGAVGSALQLPRQRRRRAMEEIRNHLDDGASAHMREGVPRPQAVALAITEMGEADTVAAGFNDDGTSGSQLTGVRRWLPMLLTMFVFTMLAGFAIWSATWILGGWTDGERSVQRRYLVDAALAGLLTYGAYVSVKRSQRDASWRWAAWACACLAVGVVVLNL